MIVFPLYDFYHDLKRNYFSWKGAGEFSDGRIEYQNEDQGVTLKVKGRCAWTIFGENFDVSQYKPDKHPDSKAEQEVKVILASRKKLSVGQCVNQENWGEWLNWVDPSTKGSSGHYETFRQLATYQSEV